MSGLCNILEFLQDYRQNGISGLRFLIKPKPDTDRCMCMEINTHQVI
jgi:hypothetical protein